MQIIGLDKKLHPKVHMTPISKHTKKERQTLPKARIEKSTNPCTEFSKEFTSNNVIPGTALN